MKVAMKEKKKWLCPKLLVFVRGKGSQEFSLYNCKGYPRNGEPAGIATMCKSMYRYGCDPCSAVTNS